MPNFEHIWREQCEAAETIRARHGEQAAFDYLVGEKLLHFVSVARDHSRFAAQLPAFVAEVRRLFAADVLASYLDALEARLVQAAHDVDEDDIESLSVDTTALESLRQVADLLRATNLGTA